MKNETSIRSVTKIPRRACAERSRSARNDKWEARDESDERWDYLKLGIGELRFGSDKCGISLWYLRVEKEALYMNLSAQRYLRSGIGYWGFEIHRGERGGRRGFFFG